MSWLWFVIGLVAGLAAGSVITIRLVPFMLARMTEPQLDGLAERVWRHQHGRIE